VPTYAAARKSLSVGLRDALGLTRALDRGEIRPPADTMPRLGLGSPWADPGDVKPIIFADVFGIDVLPVSRAEALAVPPMWRGRNLLTSTIARTPLRAYDAADQVITPAPPWITRTDSVWPPFHRMLWTVDDLIFHGCSLWWATRGADTFPLTLDRVPFSDWEVTPDGAIEVNGAPVKAGQVVYIAGPHEGILTYGTRAIRMAGKLDVAALDTAERPFKLELHQTSGDELDDVEIAELVAGARKAIMANLGILFTNPGIKAEVHALDSGQLLTEGRNYSAIDCARLVGVPAATIDATLAGSGITYQTGPMLNRTLIDYGAAGYMSAISASLTQNTVTPNGQRVAFDLEAFLQANPTAPGLPGAPAPGESPTEDMGGTS
jgi:hypothetical protein